jgi:hypothetical protein
MLGIGSTRLGENRERGEIASTEKIQYPAVGAILSRILGKERTNRLADRWIAAPGVLHPYPVRRFDPCRPGREPYA